MVWEIEKPINKLPKEISKYFREQADYLKNDLYERKLEVVLIPAPYQRFEGHKIRAVQNENPKWYRELYHTIKNFSRRESLLSLERISKMVDKEKYKYDSLMRGLILNILTEGYEEDGLFFPKNNEVEKYFLFLEERELAYSEKYIRKIEDYARIA